MNIVIAMDSFKGSLSSVEAGSITATAIRTLLPTAVIKIFPLADGGEGTVNTLTEGLGGHIITTQATGPLGQKIICHYGIIKSTRTAIIETANVAGLSLIPTQKRNPLYTTTYGLGELILHAINNDCRNFIIGIGGSATNDCGIGMLTALGVQFLNNCGQPAGINGQNLADVVSIDLSQLCPDIKNCSFHIACDVSNPLCGNEGCAAVYGPQKGATSETIEFLDKAASNFAKKIHQQLGCDEADKPGAGAAGGLGYAFATFLPAALEPGVSLVLDAINIKSALKNADIVITGEGCLDEQTIMGKAPVGVAQLAKKINKKTRVIAFSGGAKPMAEKVNQYGIDAYFPILHLPMDTQTAMQPETARLNLRQTVTQVFRLLV